ncbi:hypothetical protein V1525DRAFT_244857 [Lipomyces kononenkoae]|uniref:Uncharacterized protein n=1 Tax=Lipomyces kononenkoae TaxID=34357 RepID=A0ACC3T849_LIPKO
MAPSHVAIQPAGRVIDNHSVPPPAIAPRYAPESPTDVAAINGVRPSKEWVLPPRLKPGRKPSSETPPTKRKAQNRAAQRAFRERRAARVVELEERLQELESEKEEKETRLTSTLTRISAENQELKSITDELKRQLDIFKQFQAQQATMVATGQTLHVPMLGVAVAQQQLPHHLVSPAPSPGSNEQIYGHDMQDRALERDGGSKVSSGIQYQYASPSTGTVPIRRSIQEQRRGSSASSPLTPSSQQGRATNSPTSYAQLPSISVANDPSPLHTPKAETDKCGLCHSDGNCLCNDIGITPATDILPKRRHSPVSAETLETNDNRIKRHHDDDLEMDFTHAFQTAKIIRKKGTVRQQPQQHQLQQQPEEYHFGDSNDFTSTISPYRSEIKTNLPVTDPCGFCASGTPCLCAEAANSEANNSIMDSQIMENGMHTILPPLRNPHHPRNETQNKLHTLHPEPISDVTATPGTAPSSHFAPGTCEACQRDPMQTLFCTSLASRPQDASGDAGCGNCDQPGGCCGGRKDAPDKDAAFIPCSAAYRTLSRHKGFKAVELPSLVGKLSTSGGQVEVASVASVLRELDRRLYS